MSASKELLAIGIFGSHSRLGDRIELLLRRNRKFSEHTSGRRFAAGAAALAFLTAAGSLAPRWVALAQQPPLSQFEAASVKRSTADPAGPSSFRLFGESPTFSNVTVQSILQNAWQVRNFQIAGAPAWINSERFNIDARAPGNPTVDQKRLMLRKLMADRFKLALRIETRELPIFQLVVAKGGPKLTKSACLPFDPLNPTPASGKTRLDYCGYGGFANDRFEASSSTMADLAVSLSQVVGRSVVDKTGIEGTFRIELKYAEDVAAAAADDNASIFEAVQEQLGLKLESAKGPVEVLVIDHIERPTEN
jgi:uncharacterized protein (TIGR03435 family)